MRLIAALVVSLALAGAAAAAPIKVTITAANHAPKVNVTWKYSVKVVDASGKPVAAKLSLAVIDPVGGVHPVEFLKKKKYVTKFPISGVFSDAIIWPPASVGYVLKLRATAVANGVTATTIFTLKVK